MLVISFDIGIINLCVCVSLNDNIIIWKIIRLLDKCPKSLSIDLLTSNLYLNMDLLISEIKDITSHDIDSVLLENQPCKASNNIKITQTLLYGYFYNLKHYDAFVKNIYQVSPSLKLKEFYSDVDRTGLSRPEQYKQNKKVSIQLCSEFIQDSPRLTDMFKECNKKDDMADSLLMLLAWIKKHHKIQIKPC
tara:strand:+ start:8159 stop:8731 length:573 start_codon:yes stop_codon:yes gene_type:complete